MNRILLLLASMFLFGAVFASAQEEKPALTIVAPDGQQTILTVSDLKRLQQHVVELANSRNGSKEKFEGVLLVDLLRAVGALDEAKLDGKHTRDSVVLETADGVKTVFTLADLHLEMQSTDPAILATKCDDMPLRGKKGPVQLVLPQDKTLSRSMTMLATIRIQNAQ